MRPIVLRHYANNCDAAFSFNETLYIERFIFPLSPSMQVSSLPLWGESISSGTQWPQRALRTAAVLFSTRTQSRWSTSSRTTRTASFATTPAQRFFSWRRGIGSTLAWRTTTSSMMTHTITIPLEASCFSLCEKATELSSCWSNPWNYSISGSQLCCWNQCQFLLHQTLIINNWKK